MLCVPENFIEKSPRLGFTFKMRIIQKQSWVTTMKKISKSYFSMNNNWTHVVLANFLIPKRTNYSFS